MRTAIIVDSCRLALTPKCASGLKTTALMERSVHLNGLLLLNQNCTRVLRESKKPKNDSPYPSRTGYLFLRSQLYVILGKRISRCAEGEFRWKAVSAQYIYI